MSKLITFILYAGVLLLAAYTGQESNIPPAIPVMKTNTGNTSTTLEYSAFLQGANSMEIQIQVSSKVSGDKNTEVERKDVNNQ